MKTLKLIFFISIFWLNSNVSAQYVTIPDPYFVTYLQNNYPSCMNGNQLDTTCWVIINETFVSVNFMDISDLTGIQYFTNLTILYCEHNQLTSLPELSVSLTFLNCDNNQLTSLPDLSPVLSILYCAQNQLTSLPVLPNSLLTFKCYNNQLTILPNLPASLQTLVCGNNHLTSLPELPNTLTFLSCYNNQLTSLPDLSLALITLYCDQNQFTSLPDLPSSLLYLTCNDNQLNQLPILPNLLLILMCQNNNILCFPIFPISIEQMYISNNPNTCLPNYIDAMDSVELIYPLCIENDTIINPNQCETNSLAENTKSKIKIYPNPFSSITTIKFEKQMQNVNFSLYNIYGQQVKEELNFSGDKYVLQKENLTVGTYILDIQGKNLNQKVKLVLGE
jgi:Leucine-rich repeat (LRR) protein